jgi:oxygen-independent coproporphyrinogen-3 oxidase
MADVLRLFYGEIGFIVNSGSTEADICIRHTLTEHNGLWDCAFSLNGKSLLVTAPVPLNDGNMLLQKRFRKRLCKQTLYSLLKTETGIHPPWGSLTGIRPTRLVYEAMRDGLSSTDAARQVESTFDLHHDKAQLLSDIVNTQLTMTPPNLMAADVYIGIPFCRTRCAYCSFLSGELGKGLMVQPYVDALIQEMAFTAHLMKDTGLALHAVYMGGGTPTALPESAFRRVMEAMVLYFPHALEYTVEAGRPDSISRDKLKAIREAGVGRISINPQSMRAETLKRIGRDHTPEQTVEAYELARDMGFQSINMDLIAGLPGETVSDFEYTLSWARKLMPESLTIHTLALKRASLLRLWEIPLPDGNETASMVRLGAETAREMGLRPYYLYRQKYMAGNQENVGYALPGHECLYNVDIMEETQSILAVGAGAISKRVFGGEGRIERAPNVSNIGVYIERLDEMQKRKAGLFTE